MLKMRICVYTIDLLGTFPTSVSATCSTALTICGPTNSPHQVSQCVQDSSVALPRIEDYLHCSSLLLILVLPILSVTSRQSLISVHHQAVPLPQLPQSVGRQWL